MLVFSFFASIFIKMFPNLKKELSSLWGIKVFTAKYTKYTGTSTK